jgi:hypothetical protein
VCVCEGFEFALEEAAFGFGVSAGESALEEGSGLGEIAELAVELALGGVAEAVTLRLVVVGDGLKGVECGGWPFDLAQGYGAVDEDDGGGLELLQEIVEGEDVFPVGEGEAVGGDVGGGQFGLKVIGGEVVSVGGLAEVSEAAVDHGAVPEGAVLLFEEEKIAGGVDAGGEACGLEEHEGQQGVDLGLNSGGVFGKGGGKTDGFGAEVVFDEVVAGGGGVALSEEEVEDVEDGFETFGELGGAGDFEADVVVANGTLGADEALADGDLGGEEGAGYLGDSEAADDFESEGYAGGAGEGGVAADEDEGELLVSYFAGEVDGGAALAGVYLAGEYGLGFVVVDVEAAVFFENVEGSMVGDLYEPGLGMVWGSMEGPMLQGLEQGVLYSILGDGQVPCAKDACEVGDHAAELVAEEMVHEFDAGGGGFGGCGWLCHGDPRAG